MATVKNNDVNM